MVNLQDELKQEHKVMQTAASNLGELYRTSNPMSGPLQGVMACIDAITSQQRMVDGVKNKIEIEKGAIVEA